jgi:hypothetical protein
MPRRRQSPGAWHHSFQQHFFSSAQAALTIKSQVIFTPNVPGTVRALSLDLTGFDTQSSHWQWALLVIPSGASSAIGPFVNDTFQDYFWLHGGELLTASYGLHVHAAPKTARRMQAGDTLVVYVENLDATSASFQMSMGYDFYYKAM